MSQVVLLGPQRFRPSLRDTVRSLGVEGPVAVVTAGWQERESEDKELEAHLDCEVVDLLLYHRYDDVLSRDPELRAALRERQNRLKELQELYRLRLGHMLQAARELMAREGRGLFLREQRQAAIRAVRTLDRQHLRRLSRIHEEFAWQWQPAERAPVAHHRRQLAGMLGRASVLAIAGGHVSVLLNRLRLFDLLPLVAGRPIVAWSAGAMALADRVVLFHDSPPQGAGNAEVLDRGLGWCRGIVPLPHARRRLRLDDPVRVALFARRFSPSTCVILDETARLAWDGERWRAAPGTRALLRAGRVRAMAAA